MKKIIIIFFYLIFLIIDLSAQVPIIFNYQAVVRDTMNQPYKQQPLHLEIAILDQNDQEVYSDEHEVITTTLGVFNIQVGNGDNPNGDLATIDWDNGGPFYLHTKVTIGATNPKTFSLTPTQLVFVPNALYAIQARKSKTLDGFAAGTGINVTANVVSNTGVLKVVPGTGISLQGTPADPVIVNDGVLKTDQAGGQLTGIFSNLSIASLNARNGDVLQYDQPSQKWLPGVSAPVGSIMIFGGPESTVPAGWLLCNGRAVDRTGVYSSLFNVIGTLWGSGNGSSTFNIPDLQGVFLRGTSYNSVNNLDPEKNSRTPKGTGLPNEVGSYQGDSNLAHTHNGVTNIGGAHTHTNQRTYIQDNDDNDRTICAVGFRCGDDPNGASVGGDHTITETGSAHQHGFTTDFSGSAESRPRNVYVNYIISKNLGIQPKSIKNCFSE
jgi:microcystin-dependent protein